MAKKLTQEDFLIKANKKHNKKYDYSCAQNINNLNNKSLIAIICPVHGLFQQRIGNHINNGHGCPKCALEIKSKKRRSSLKEIIDKANKKHSNLYSYCPNQEYKNNNSLLNITCPKHGTFKQSAKSHLSGKGCRQCAIEKNANKQKKSPNEILKDFIKVHGNKYDYSLIEKEKIKNNQSIIKIICPIKGHGIFKQKIGEHFNGKGCPLCGGTKKLSTKEFIDKAKKIHGEKTYDYSKVIYVNAHTNVSIVCNEHGSFEQKAYGHLLGYGCAKCAKKRTIKTSKNQKKLFEHLKYKLDNITVELEKTIELKERFVQVDIYIAEKNVIVEYYGDYWHCNPKLYKSDYYHSRLKLKAKNIWKKDEKRKRELEKLGYKVIVVWESDFNTNEKKVIDNCLKQI